MAPRQKNNNLKKKSQSNQIKENSNLNSVNDEENLLEEEDDLIYDFTSSVKDKDRFLREMTRDDSSKLDQWRKRVKDKEKDKSTIEGVLDLPTSKVILKIINKGYFTSLGGIISTGKEANVYYAKTKDLSLTYEIKHLALKIYRTRTLDFKKIHFYIDGDRRFQQKAGRKSHQIIEKWAMKEYKNLLRAYEAGLPVPRPVLVKRNVLLMEFIDDGLGTQISSNSAANTLQSLQNNKSFLSHAKEIYDQILNCVKILWQKAGIVHGDLSEFNILGKIPARISESFHFYIIDISQAVLISHGSAKILLLRDLTNVNNFFNLIETSNDIKIEPASIIYQRIVGEPPLEKDLLSLELK
ncbi:MAG: serine protein kinase RIO [Candidatus Thorarchaeota archaeon]